MRQDRRQGDSLDRAGWLRQAWSIFAADHGIVAGNLIVELRSEAEPARRVTWIVPPPVLPAAPPSLKPIEADILEALGRDTLPAREIAARAGYALNSHFRSVLSRLKKAGLIALTLEGYRRT